MINTVERQREVQRRKHLQASLPLIADPEGMGIGLKRCPHCQTIMLSEEETCPRQIIDAKPEEKL